MEYAQTIAMASDLLGDGRADAVVQMVEPLLQSIDDPKKADPGQVQLHALMACVDVVHRGRPHAATRRLSAFRDLDARTSLPDKAQAEVALWLGWGYAFQNARSDEEARALSLLDEAEQRFAKAHVPSRRVWALIGQAQAYFALDEYHLMRRALDEASEMHRATQDALAKRWIHELRIPALRFQGRYADAQHHVDALMHTGREWSHRRVEAHAHAHQAALDYDLGRAPSRILDTAETAQRLLRRVDGDVGYPLLAACHAQIGVLLRQEQWSDAVRHIDRAEDDFHDYPAGRAHLLTLRARLAFRQGDDARAEALLSDVRDQVRSLPHGLQRSHVALLHGDLLVRTGREGDGIAWLEKAHRNARETGHRGNQLRALLSLSRAHLASGDTSAADGTLQATDAFSDYFSVLPFSVHRFRTLGDRARTEGDASAARAAYTQALTAASLIGDTFAVREVNALLSTSSDWAASPASGASSLAVDARNETSRVREPLATFRTAPSSFEPEDDELGDWERSVGSALAHASLSVDLVIETWIRSVERLLPNRWIGVYRRTSDADWSCVHEHGTPPDAIPHEMPRETPHEMPDADGLGIAAGDDETQERESVTWIRLPSDEAFVFVMGVETSDLDDETWARVQNRLAPWLPVVQLALDRALLRGRFDAPSAESTETDPATVPLDGFVAQSLPMQHLARQIRRIQTSHSPVLITGETGTDMDLVGRAVHVTSERSDGPFATVRCASLQRDPVEARLFGRRNPDGTLTSGALQTASGGTLLLRDVDELPLPVQSSLLRVIEAQEVVPQDDTEPIPVDVRIIATTSNDLRAAIADDRFHEGLYYQLNVIPLRVPPLRERSEDIPLLARHFLNALRPTGTPQPVVTNRAVEALLRYDWPGNVRQLRNEMERVLVFVGSEPTPTVDLDVLSDSLVDAVRDPDGSSPPPDASGAPEILDANRTLRDVLADTEKAVIERALRACDGQVTATADVLGLTRQGLYKKMKRLDVDPADFQPVAT